MAAAGTLKLQGDCREEGRLARPGSGEKEGQREGRADGDEKTGGGEKLLAARTGDEQAGGRETRRDERLQAKRLASKT